MRRICYFVFDVLYLNGTCLINEPLETRFSKLNQIIQDKPTFVEILPMLPGHTLEDLEQSLDVSMEKGQEGVMIKDPLSVYNPGSRENWFKLKPDYFDALSDDIDVLLVGATYGEGRRGGKFSSFVCAVREDPAGGYTTDQEPVFQTVCRVGSGLTDPVIDRLSKDSHLWPKFNPDAIPPWLHVTIRTKADRLIPPSMAPVVQIRASQATYENGAFELRFPRFIQFRSDKSIESMTTLSELTRLAKRINGRLQSRLDSKDEKSPRATKRAKTVASRQVLSGHQGADVRDLTAISSIFSNLEFCVTYGSGYDPTQPDQDLTRLKQDLEKKIVVYGGAFTQKPREGVIVVVDKILASTRNMIASGKYDVIKSKYIVDCIEARRLLDLHPRWD